MENLQQRREALILQRDRLSRVNRASTTNLLEGINERLASVEHEIEQRNRTIALKEKQLVNERQASIDSSMTAGMGVHSFVQSLQSNQVIPPTLPHAPLLVDLESSTEHLRHPEKLCNLNEQQDLDISIKDGDSSNVAEETIDIVNNDDIMEPPRLHVELLSQSAEEVNIPTIKSMKGESEQRGSSNTPPPVVQRRPSQLNITSNERKEYARQQFDIGRECEDLGHLVAAIESYRLALAWCPMMAEAAYNLAMVLTDLGKNEEALIEYGKVITILQVNRTIINMIDDGSKANDDTIEDGVSLTARTYYNIGLILDEAGNLHSALEQYKKAVEIAPEWIEARHNLTVVQQEIRTLEEKEEERQQHSIEENYVETEEEEEEQSYSTNQCLSKEKSTCMSELARSAPVITAAHADDSHLKDYDESPHILNSNQTIRGRRDEEVEIAASIISESDSEEESDGAHVNNDDDAEESINEDEEDSIATGSSDSDESNNGHGHHHHHSHRHEPYIEDGAYIGERTTKPSMSYDHEVGSDSEDDQHHYPLPSYSNQPTTVYAHDDGFWTSSPPPTYLAATSGESMMYPSDHLTSIQSFEDRQQRSLSSRLISGQERRRSSIRLPGETLEEYSDRRRIEMRQERAMRPPPEVVKPQQQIHGKRIGGNLAKQTRTVNLRERQRISSLPKILKERDERKLSALHMANSHVVGRLQVEDQEQMRRGFPTTTHETNEQQRSRRSNHNRHLFGSPASAVEVVDVERRRSLPIAPVTTIEIPYYARQQPVPHVGVRDSCVIV